MKNILLVVITFFTINVIAQEKKVKTDVKKHDQAEILAKSESKKLTKQLDLSSDQQEKIYNVMLQHYKEELKNKKEIKKMISANDKADKAEVKKAISKQKQGYSEKLHNQLKEILTEQQYKSYIETQKKQQKTKQKIMSKKN